MSHRYKIGQTIVIRTVTMIQVGKLVEVCDQELVLVEAAWIADTGRWADFLRGKMPDEVEPFADGEVFVGRGALIDAQHVDIGPFREQV